MIRIHRFASEEEVRDAVRFVKPWEAPFEEAREELEDDETQPLDFNDDGVEGGFERGYN